MTARRRPVEEWVDDVFASDLSTSAKIVALAMARFMDWHTLGGVWVSPTRLAEMTGLTVRSVRRSIRLLLERGAIRQTSKGGAPHRTSTYCGVTPRHATSESAVTEVPDWRDTGSKVQGHSVTQSLQGVPSGNDVKRSAAPVARSAPGGAARSGARPRGKTKAARMREVGAHGDLSYRTHTNAVTFVNDKAVVAAAPRADEGQGQR